MSAGHRAALCAIVTTLSSSCISSEEDTVGEAEQALIGANPYSQSFTTFESGQVRPLALSADEKSCSRPTRPTPPRDLRGQAARPRPRGLGAGRPRAGRGRGAQQRRGLGRQPPLRQRQHRRRSTASESRVVRTLLVGDEPRDIVFAGPGGNRAFITTAHRGQNTPVDPAARRPPASAAPTSGSSTPTHLGDGTLGGAPLDDPHALRRHAARARGDARTARGSTPPSSTPATPPPRPSSATSRASATRCRRSRRRRSSRSTPASTPSARSSRPTSVIVKYDGAHWRDETGAQLGRRGQVHAARPGRLRDRRQRQPAGAGRRARRRRTRASARSSSTWSSTR